MSLFADSNRYLIISSEIMPITSCSHLLVWYFLLILHMGIAECAMFVGSWKLQSPSLYLGILRYWLNTDLVWFFKNMDQNFYTLNSFISFNLFNYNHCVWSKPLGLCCVLNGQHCKPLLSTVEKLILQFKKSRTLSLSSITDPLLKEPLVHCRQAVQTHPNKSRTEAFAN